MKAKWFSTLLIVLMLVVAIAPAASAAQNASGGIDSVPKKDNLPDPLTTMQLDLKEKAIEAKLNGKAHGKTHEVARGQYVQLDLEGTGMVWTVMGERKSVGEGKSVDPGGRRIIKKKKRK